MGAHVCDAPLFYKRHIRILERYLKMGVFAPDGLDLTRSIPELIASCVHYLQGFHGREKPILASPVATVLQFIVSLCKT